MCPVWPYLFDIWPFTLCLIRTTICPTYADKFAKYYLVNHKNGQRFWNIYQRGKISPNLVTVSLTHSLTHSLTYSNVLNHYHRYLTHTLSLSTSLATYLVFLFLSLWFSLSLSDSVSTSYLFLVFKISCFLVSKPTRSTSYLHSKATSELPASFEAKRLLRNKSWSSGYGSSEASGSRAHGFKS